MPGVLLIAETSGEQLAATTAELVAFGTAMSGLLLATIMYLWRIWNDQKALLTPPAPHVRDQAPDRLELVGISRLCLDKNAGDAPHGLNPSPEWSELRAVRQRPGRARSQTRRPDGARSGGRR